MLNRLKEFYCVYGKLCKLALCKIKLDLLYKGGNREFEMLQVAILNVIASRRGTVDIWNKQNP